MATKRVARCVLTQELLAKWKDLPDNACLDSNDLHELLGRKSLSAMIRNKLLPECSQPHMQCSKTYRYKQKSVAVEPNSRFYYKFGSYNTKLYWRIGELRAFVRSQVQNSDMETR